MLWPRPPYRKHVIMCLITYYNQSNLVVCLWISTIRYHTKRVAYSESLIATHGWKRCIFYEVISNMFTKDEVKRFNSLSIPCWGSVFLVHKARLWNQVLHVLVRPFFKVHAIVFCFLLPVFIVSRSRALIGGSLLCCNVMIIIHLYLYKELTSFVYLLHVVGTFHIDVKKFIQRVK